MRAPLIAAVVVFALGVAVLQASGVIPFIGDLFDRHSATINYRLNVKLLVDGKPVSGSVVQQVRIDNAGGNGKGAFLLTSTRISGEALVLEIPGHPVLVVPMSFGGDTGGYEQIFFRACGLTLGDEPTNTFIDRVAAFTGACPIPTDQLPEFLSLSDIDDPFSMLVANPQDLAASFGRGVEFVKATVSTTTNPIESKIEATLPWTRADSSQFNSKGGLNLWEQIHVTRSIFVSGPL
jgi:hypothetical protein